MTFFPPLCEKAGATLMCQTLKTKKSSNQQQMTITKAFWTHLK